MKPILLKDFTLVETPSLVTLGVFDGVHLGHQKVLQQTVSTAQEMNLSSIIISFYPHPRKVISGHFTPCLLNTIEERIEKLKMFQSDYLIIVEFSNELAKQTTRNFMENTLISLLNLKALMIGHNQCIGSDQLSGTNLLNLGKEKDIDVFLVKEHSTKGTNISSSIIRNLLYQGKIQSANQLLGYFYTFTGVVVKGSQFGRTIGFPTANLNIEDRDKLLPKQGVYLVKAKVYDNLFFGMMNIGTKPTTGSSKNVSIEVHLFDISVELYGHVLQVYLLEYLRKEKKFNSSEKLREQLKKDQAMCLKSIKDRNLEL